jgi:hypothetical protein
MRLRAISTVGIWAATAVILAAGLFQRSWTGDLAVFLMLMVVLVVCASAAGATLAVWQPGKPKEGSPMDRTPPNDVKTPVRDQGSQAQSG